jgi:hypothetical protein
MREIIPMRKSPFQQQNPQVGEGERWKIPLSRLREREQVTKSLLRGGKVP